MAVAIVIVVVGLALFPLLGFSIGIPGIFGLILAIVFIPIAASARPTAPPSNAFSASSNRPKPWPPSAAAGKCAGQYGRSPTTFPGGP